MADDPKKTPIDPMDDSHDELNLGQATLRGKVLEPFMPAIQNTADTATALTRLIKNLVAWPLNRFNKWAEEFQRRVDAKIEPIPEPLRQLPPPRLATQVMLEASYCDDDDLQEMFAQLLATSMDSSKATLAHPSFPQVIKQLGPDDARVLRYLHEEPTRVLTAARGGGFHRGANRRLEEVVNIETAVHNLVRLGLLEWRREHVGPFEFHGVASGPRMRGSDASAESIVDELGSRVGKALQRLSRQSAVLLSTFGKQFVAACIGTSAKTGPGGVEGA